MLHKHNKMRTLTAANKYHQYRRPSMSSLRSNTFPNIYRVEKDSRMISMVAFTKITAIDNHRNLSENSYVSKRVGEVRTRPRTEYRSKASYASTIKIYKSRWSATVTRKA